jgi:hypothetical protein
MSLPEPPSPGHVGPFLLGGVQSFFCFIVKSCG